MLSMKNPVWLAWEGHILMKQEAQNTAPTDTVRTRLSSLISGWFGKKSTIFAEGSTEAVGRARWPGTCCAIN
jgi:hypothetical protein